MKTVVLIFLLAGFLILQPAMGQRLVSFDDSNLELKEGFKIDIFESPAAQRPTWGFILKDSLAYVIGLESYLNSIRLDGQNRALDSLNTLLQLRIQNFEAQVDLLNKQIEVEQKAFETLQELSQTKDAIAQDGINALKRFRRKGWLFGGAAGLLAGALWIRSGDSNAVRIAKPVGLAASGVYLSFTIFD